MNQTNKVLLQAEISATSKGLVDALNKATGAINQTSSNWKDKFASLKESTSSIGQSVKNLADLVSQVGKVDMDVDGLDKIHSSIAEITGAFDKVRGEVDTFVAGLVEIKNAASDLGMPVDEYQRFADAIKASGMSMEEGVGMLQAMRQNIADFANGVPEVADRFAQLGLTIEQLSSNTVTGNFDAIVQALQSVVQPTEQAQASMEQFRTSMERAVKVSQEYNKLLIDQTNNAYASDRDVQNAIGLSNAIGLLGDRLSQYISKTSDATSASNGFSRTLEGMWDKLKREQDMLSALSVEYNNYVESLKNSVTSTLDASKAIEVFARNVNDLKNEAYGLRTSLGTGSDKSIEEAKSSFQNLVNFLLSSKETIKDEIDAIIAIMHQRIQAGAPIDTKALETAINHVNILKQAIADLGETQNHLNLDFSSDSVKQIQDLELYIHKAQGAFERFSELASQSNNTLDFSEARERVRELENDLRKLFDDFEKTGRLTISTDELEKIRYELSQIAGTKWNLSLDSSEVDEVVRKASELKDRIARVNAESAKGPSIWKQIKNAVRDCWDAMRGTNVAVDNTSNTLQRVGGQLLGMGSKVAVIVKGFRTLGDIIKVYVVDWLTKAAEEARKLQSIMSSAWTQTAEANQRRFEAIEQEMQNYSELLRKWRESGSAVDENALRMKGREISIKYGIDVTPDNFDNVLQSTLDWTRNGRRDSIESQIRSLEAMNEALDEEYRERDSYLKNDLGKSIQEKYQGKQRLVEIAKEKGANEAKIMALREQLRLLKQENKMEEMFLAERARTIDAEKATQREQPIGRWGVGNIDLYDRPIYRNEDGSISTVDSMSFNENGKEVLIPKIARDSSGNAVRLSEEQAIRRYRITGEYLGKFDNAADANDYAERLHKEQEARVIALEKANQNLQDWGNSLTDNDRQRELRAILDKYNSLVQDGVNAEQARIVATKAIEEMLHKEMEEEQKRNRELLEALQDRIDQYKSAYQAYVESERGLQEARREERELIKQQNRERRSEAIQRKRDRIQQRLSRFGFTPYEGFQLNESESHRMRRKRTIELDAGIAEKMARSQSGERVSWSSQERQRILEYQHLQRRDKSLEAAQKQMSAAEKQRQAADTMKDAAKAISNALAGRNEAQGNLRASGNELSRALGNRPVMSNFGRADQLFLNAMRNGLNARGVSGAWSQTQGNYNQQLNQLHTDLQAIGKNVYVVR